MRLILYIVEAFLGRCALPVYTKLFGVFFLLLAFCYCGIARFIKGEKTRRVFGRILLLLASYIFYCYANMKFLPVLLYVTALTYLGGVVIGKKEKLLWPFVILVLIPLLAYKYLGWGARQIELPLGISFFTLQSITYLVAIHKKKIPTETDLFKIALFVSFFPAVSSGPILRAEKILPQFDKVEDFDYERVTDGLRLYAFGLFKKMVVADNLALYVSSVQGSAFNGESTGLGAAIILSAVLYSFQLYADFSGYSDIVIGCSRILGFDIGRNFDHPYLSGTVSEFWRRWHISLSSWLRDYVYIPLGGSRVSKINIYRNTLIVFLVSGLWHGNGWTFVVWGLLHGLFVCADRVFGFGKDGKKRLWNIFVTFVLVTFAWMFFSAPSMHSLFTEFRGIGTIGADLGRFFAGDIGVFELFAVEDSYSFLIAIISNLVFLICSIITYKQEGTEFIRGKNAAVRWALYFALILSILCFSASGHANFIYNEF